MENNVVETIHVTCVRCGDVFDITPAEQRFYNAKGFNFPKRCKKCRALRGTTEVYKCIDCNREFTVSALEKEYYAEHDLQLPKRCKECREAKRIRNAEAKNNEQGNAD